MFFFAPEFGGVRFAAAAREADRMLLVEHLVIQDVSDDVLRNSRSVELPVDDDLVQRRIEAAQLRAPRAAAPAEARARKRAPKVGVIQPVEERREIVMLSGRLVRDAARPALALQQDALPRGTRVGELAVDFD